MTEGKAGVMIERAGSRRKVRFSCALLLTTEILMQAADEGVGAVQVLRMNEVELRRQKLTERTLANGFR